MRWQERATQAEHGWLTLPRNLDKRVAAWHKQNFCNKIMRNAGEELKKLQLDCGVADEVVAEKALLGSAGLRVQQLEAGALG